MKNIKRKLAFTLIEMVIYIAVLSVMMTALVGILISITKTNNSITRQQQLQNVKLFLNEHIQSSFQASHLIVTPSNTTQGNEITTGTLTIGTNNINNYFDYQYNSTLKKLYFYSGVTPTPFVLTVSSITGGGTLPIDTYFYRIVGLDGVGNSIAISNQFTANVISNNSTVNLSWTAPVSPIISSYKIFRYSISDPITRSPVSTTALTTYADGTLAYSASTLNYASTTSSTCTDINCKSLTNPDYVYVNSFQTFLIKDSSGQNNGIRIHIELQNTGDDKTKTNLDTQYTL